MPLTAAWENPQIEIQEVLLGNTFTGVASNGILDPVGVGAPYYAGRVKFTKAGTTGGLFGPSPEGQGCSIAGVQFVGSGTTGFVLSVKQTLFPAAAAVANTYKVLDIASVGYQDNNGAGLVTIDPASFVFYFRHPVFVQPKAEILVTTTGILLGSGRCSIIYANGWGVPPLAAID